MNDDNITIDPITLREFNDAVSKAFNEVMDELEEDALEEIDLDEALFMIFFNGFYRGCMAMTDNPDLQETIHMMSKEINYQMKK